MLVISDWFLVIGDWFLVIGESIAAQAAPLGTPTTNN
jgi:hypothetical protein